MAEIVLGIACSVLALSALLVAFLSLLAAQWNGRGLSPRDTVIFAPSLVIAVFWCGAAILLFTAK